MASHSGYDYNRRMGPIDRTTGPSLTSRSEGGAACLPSPPAARRKNLRLPIERLLVTCHLPGREAVFLSNFSDPITGGEMSVPV